MATPLSLMIASSDPSFRDMVHDNILNIPDLKVVAEFTEVAANLYVRVLQELERHASAGLVVDLASSPDIAFKALERVKQAIPDLYVIASHFIADGETVIQAMRAGANEFLLQPLKRVEFREAMSRFERAPRRISGPTESRLGKVYTFLGAKGGVGTTSLAVNFASVLAQRKKETVLLDIDWVANDAAMQLGAAPQYTLMEVADNMAKLDQALFEGFVTRDPLGFFLVGPPDSLDNRNFFSDHMFREFATFLIEKYDSVVVDAGKNINDDVVMSACQVSSTIFLVVTQELPSLRNAQRYVTALAHLGVHQDQIKVVVNHYSKKASPHHATLEQISQTLNQPVFFGIPSSPVMLASLNKGRPMVTDRAAAPELDKAFRSFVDKATGAKATPLTKTAGSKLLG
jgi:pilus assembly protein CpaE